MLKFGYGQLFRSYSLGNCAGCVLAFLLCQNKREVVFMSTYEALMFAVAFTGLVLIIIDIKK